MVLSVGMGVALWLGGAFWRGSGVRGFLRFWLGAEKVSGLDGIGDAVDFFDFSVGGVDDVQQGDGLGAEHVRRVGAIGFGADAAGHGGEGSAQAARAAGVGGNEFCHGGVRWRGWVEKALLGEVIGQAGAGNFCGFDGVGTADDGGNGLAGERVGFGLDECGRGGVECGQEVGAFWFGAVCGEF